MARVGHWRCCRGRGPSWLVLGWQGPAGWCWGRQWCCADLLPIGPWWGPSSPQNPACVLAPVPSAAGATLLFPEFSHPPPLIIPHHPRFNPFEGWVSSQSVGDDILISGRIDMNRALDGGCHVDRALTAL
jgi:hypothetical protein